MQASGYELLLPVGHMEMALAAIHNGADAIYVGFPGYNARGRSIDLETEELRKIIETCHLYGVKAHLALNIVIFQEELEKLVPLLERILPLKPDALIVQDLGLARLIRQMAPDQVLHASTQMTITNPDAIALLEDLNFRRFVLGRENSIPEIRLIKAQTNKDLEVFVHGALCVAYSGQCFTSETIGGRSANRGQCAQSCRFAYQLIVNGEVRDTIQKEHLVSPQDLCGIAEIPELMDIGVHSFKIEGRLKSPDYVASAAHEYRRAIDRHLASRDLSPKELEAGRARMAATYSRGFFSGWLHGVDHQRLVDGTFSSSRGYRIGSVEEIHGNTMVAKLEKPVELTSGDGLLWAYTTPKGSLEKGGQIYGVRSLGKSRFELQFANDIDLREEALGASLYLNHDHSLKKDLHRSYNDKNELKRIPVDIAVDIAVGEPLKVTMSDGHFTCAASSTLPIDEAKNKAVTDEFIRDELGALGGSVFKLRGFSARRASSAGIFIPHKEIKEVRRQLTHELEQLRSKNRVTHYESNVASSDETMAWVNHQKRGAEARASGAPTKLNVLLREKAQVFDVIEAWKNGAIDHDSLHAVILDFEFGQDYEPSVRALKEAGIRSGIATTRILKPKEYTNLIRIERVNPDVVLVRNLGSLHYFTKVSPFKGELRGDFSLNATNHLTAQFLLEKGLSSVTASYDLNSKQVSDLIDAADASRLEITAHQYMPSFHMEHCVFAAFLSKGSSFKDCGKPCEKYRVELKDQFGNHHEIKPDQECRNTMYNGTSQSAARYVTNWRKQGLGFIRYEALYERGLELTDKIRGYQELLLGKQTPEKIIEDLKLFEKYGLGEGAIGRTEEYKSRKKSL